MNDRGLIVFETTSQKVGLYLCETCIFRLFVLRFRSSVLSHARPILIIQLDSITSFQYLPMASEHNLSNRFYVRITTV